jgi:aminoglycoside 3-N-acetyltransferase
MKISKESIIKDIINLGIRHGDIIFVTADLLRVGFFEKTREETLRVWVEILLEVVGPQGTIIVASYTNTFVRFKKNRNMIFSRNTLPYSGSLSVAFFNDRRSVRSRHPTNSCIGIGLHAHEILDGHDHNSLSYSVIGKIIEMGGKNLMMGTLDKKNAPMVFHYAQECLGYTLHNPFNGLLQTYYIDDKGEMQLFTRHDCGGCSGGAYNLYGSLIVNDAIKFGCIGKAKSALIDGKKSFNIITDVIKKNRRITLCDDMNCISCYGNWSNNGLRIIWFYLRNLKYCSVKLFEKLNR